MTLPDQHLVDRAALFSRFLGSNVGLFLLVLQDAVAVVRVHRDQNATAGIDDPVGAGPAAEAAEDLAMDDTEPGASQHRDRELRHHGHMQRHPIARFQSAEIPQQGGKFVYPDIQLLIGDMLYRFVFRFRDKMNRGFILVLHQMAIDTVVARIDPTADIPFPKRRIAGIERFFPTLIPIEEVSIFVETLGKIVQAEAFINLLVAQICLGNELLRRIVIFLFLPMDGNLSLRQVVRLFHARLSHIDGGHRAYPTYQTVCKKRHPRNLEISCHNGLSKSRLPEPGDQSGGV